MGEGKRAKRRPNREERSEGKFLRERENFARKRKGDQIRTEVPERKVEKKNPKGFLFGAGEGKRAKRRPNREEGSEGKFLRERENFACKRKDDQIRTEVPEPEIKKQGEPC